MNDSFYLVIIDHRAGAFDVLGPMCDDTALSGAVFDLQQRGFNVTCRTWPRLRADDIATQRVVAVVDTALRRAVDATEEHRQLARSVNQAARALAAIPVRARRLISRELAVRF